MKVNVKILIECNSPYLYKYTVSVKQIKGDVYVCINMYMDCYFFPQDYSPCAVF